MRVVLALVGSLFVLYSLSSYGGVRAADEEVQFRAAEGLAFNGSAAVTQDLESWPGFGLAVGVDGKQYSVFGPLEPVVLSVWLRVAEPLALRMARSANIAVPHSYYVEAGTGRAAGAPQRLLECRRFLASFFQSLISASAVGIFYLFALTVSGSVTGALVASLMLGVGSPLWTYSGMFFGETYAVLLICSALLFQSRGHAFLAGVALGASASAHVSSLLWAPFLLLMTGMREEGSATSRRREAIWSLVGITLALVPLGWLQWERFGEILETGRRLGSMEARQFGYGEFILPERGLVGLVIGAGKGLFNYAPACLLALFFWQPIHRARPQLAKVLLAGVSFRILFLAARSDWHGGFCLGPRYLLLLLPAVLVAFAFWYRERRPRYLAVVLLLSLLVLQQAFFANVEIFSMYHAVVDRADRAGLDLFAADALYLDWSYTPFIAGWDFGPASWFSRLLGQSVSAATLFFGCLGTALAALLLSNRKMGVNTGS